VNAEPSVSPRRPDRRWLLAGAAIAALVLGALAAAIWSQNKAASASADVLFGIVLPDTAGREHAISQWRGKVVVVNFWATWCAPCREEMPLFVAAQREHGPRGLQFVGIAIDEPDKVRRFVEEIGVNYPALIGGYGALELSKTLGNSVMALPFSIVIRRDGTIAHTQLGELKPAQLGRILQQLL
jgi:thiol-disulfide isomerase/thioredoxin